MDILGSLGVVLSFLAIALWKVRCSQYHTDSTSKGTTRKKGWPLTDCCTRTEPHGSLY